MVARELRELKGGEITQALVCAGDENDLGRGGYVCWVLCTVEEWAGFRIPGDVRLYVVARIAQQGLGPNTNILRPALATRYQN
jgi:hypothetical protein